MQKNDDRGAKLAAAAERALALIIDMADDESLKPELRRDCAREILDRVYGKVSAGAAKGGAPPQLTQADRALLTRVLKRLEAAERPEKRRGATVKTEAEEKP